MKLIVLAFWITCVSSNYRQSPTINIQDYCQGEATIIQINASNSNGFITDSPGHHYFSNKTCKIKLEVEPKEYRLTLRFIYLDVYSKNTACNEDRVVISGEIRDRKYCGSNKPDESVYSSSNFLNVTFHTIPDSPVGKYLGFRIGYTRYHTEECVDSEYRCWFQDRCIPETLRCNTIDNCGDFSDERYCSTISAIGTAVLAACISIALLMVMILLCVCVIKVLFGKKRRERRSSSTSVPVSNIEQLQQNAGVTCAGISMPQAAPGTANPYNEPPPSYYHVHYTKADEKGDIDGGRVSINPSSSSSSAAPPEFSTRKIPGKPLVDPAEDWNRPSTISDGRYDGVNDGFVADTSGVQ